MYAYIFSGQGEQNEKIEKKLYENYKKSKKIFNISNEILKVNIINDIKKKNIYQVGIFINSILKYKKKKYKPLMIAGHSLGELSALVCNKNISFEDGLKLISKRIKYMEEDSRENPAKMIAIIGLKKNKIKSICENYNAKISNYNSSEEIIISIKEEQIKSFYKEMKKEKPKRIIQINTKGGFHSNFMKNAKKKLEKEIKKISFKKGICPIYQNVNGNKNENPEMIKKNIINQMNNPVRWIKTIKNMIKDGAKFFIECSDKKILEKFVKKTNEKIAYL